MRQSEPPLTKTECQLLDNLLDCLDRLFDNETNVIDLHDLIYATLAALQETHHATILCPLEQELLAIVRAGASRTQQRDAALAATDHLRKYLAALLPCPSNQAEM